jgi:hypothetical protein
VAQVVLWDDVIMILIEAQLQLCATCRAAECVHYHVDKKGSYLFDITEKLLNDFLLLLPAFYDQETQLPSSSLFDFYKMFLHPVLCFVLYFTGKLFLCTFFHIQRKEYVGLSMFYLTSLACNSR